jgi:hypothetical protein
MSAARRLSLPLRLDYDCATMRMLIKAWQLANDGAHRIGVSPMMDGSGAARVL